MVMYLAGIPVPTIKLTGRWRSDALIMMLITSSSTNSYKGNPLIASKSMIA